jgi:hypothetical protein
MELPELKGLVETMHGRSIDAIPVIKACFDELFKNFTGRFLFNEFVRWTSANPAIVAPLHALQVNIMNKLIGQDFWIKKQEQRYADATMKEPRYIFRFQQKISEIHERKLQSIALAKLNEEIVKVRGYSGGDKKDRKQNEIMTQFGLGDKKQQRRGVNMPGDLDLAIREGNEEILGGNVAKEEKKKPRNTTISKKSGKVSIEAPEASAVTVKENELTSNASTPGPGPVTSAARESRKTTMISNKDRSTEKASATSGKEGARTSRKTVLAPIHGQGQGPAMAGSSETVDEAGLAADAGPQASVSPQPRKGRSTFVQKK